MSYFSEDSLVEQPAITLFAELGRETANCYFETYGPGGTLGRGTSSEVLLLRRVMSALEWLDFGLPGELVRRPLFDGLVQYHHLPPAA